MYRAHEKLYKAEGIILSRRNTGETDRILTVFTKEFGKVRAIAKGIRRVTSRRAPHLEIFTRVILMLHRGTTLDSVTEVTTLDAFEDIRTDLERVSLAYLYCELVSVLLADRQEHPDIYDLLVTALTTLNSNADLDPLQSREFTLELLWTLGFLPRSKRLSGSKLQAFVESITERYLKSPKFIRQIR